ncbi:sugar kinase [Streptomyces capillispiralis]|uniref:2-dehydro-3-deoxygluconokinase n=1 Tax=Streptomyces capillispiralis TaxID=68182 RepID=A0A561TEJ1_9ACTN|nr:sugar kinase [Streptomyces capillispiralis]TWF85521.1 2-dehydro-3-deoxygluconokinase [Streptomyces capillispiralis]GHH90065.1 carbohydrate kinase [Streptomyces capillispiralis]
MDVVALGESMVTFLPTRPGRLADVPSFERGIGGAESNVACVLAAAGHTTRWISRVGTDGFGDHLLETIGGYGVDVSFVRRDPARPTGIYFRTAGDRSTDAHEVAYYRAGSAASAMSPAGVDLDAVRAGRVLHLSGITAALSADCLALMRELTAPRPGRPLISFDVNHRPALWRDAHGPEILLELARRADIVFVGEDEAEDAWGLHGARAVREALPEPGIVVVKQGRGGAVAFDNDTDGLVPEDATGTATFVRALNVDVVAAVGAGDAFAAGFLSATLRGLPVRDRLRHGHLTAAATLTTPGDLAAPPSRALADRLAALDDTAWGRLRLGPGWTQADEGAEEEVRTP